MWHMKQYSFLTKCWKETAEIRKRTAYKKIRRGVDRIMKILQVSRYEEIEVILNAGEDFFRSDVCKFMGHGAKCINFKKLTKIAKSAGYDECEFCGHFDEYTGEVLARFRKRLPETTD